MTDLGLRGTLDPSTIVPTTKGDGLMAKSAACADMGMDCPGNFTVETEDELMQHLGIHASTAHPELEMTPEKMDQMKGAIKTV